MARPLIATLRRPRWAIGTLICLAIIVLFVNLGFWQLRRLDDRRAHNSLVAGRLTAAAVTVGSLEGPGTDPDPSSLEYRRVTATGHWLAGSTVLVRSRALNEVPGFHVLGTLILDDPADRGMAVIVNRGFAPLGAGDPNVIIPVVAPKSATTRVEGVLRRSETKGWIGPTDPAEGVLDVVNRVDVARLQQQVPAVILAPLFIQQAVPDAGQGSLPEVLPLPDASNEGPHLSYAGQWFLSAMVGAIGWPLLLRKVSREQDDEAGDEDDTTDEDDPWAHASGVA
jgi:surfeit locus 1 family protein